jgi:hypothetical protein
MSVSLGNQQGDRIIYHGAFKIVLHKDGTFTVMKTR